MEAFTALSLSASPRRRSIGRGYLADDDEYALATPYASAWSSPRRAFARAGVEEAPLGEVRAAVPFVWERVPGKAKSDVESSDESTEDSSVTTEGTDSASQAVCEFSAVELPCRAAEERIANGQLMPLRLPPRLQAMRSLRNADSDHSGYSSHASFQSCLSPAQSSKKAGVQGRRSSLSPMRIFTLERNDLSPDSVSSASSSSERKANSSPEEVSPSGATLKDLLFTDLAKASMRAESLKMINSPQSRRELLKKQQEQWNGIMAYSDKDDVPATPASPLSRSNANLPRPAIDVGVKNFSQKEDIGRAIFANRFGMLCNCMGMAAPRLSP